MVALQGNFSACLEEGDVWAGTWPSRMRRHIAVVIHSWICARELLPVPHCRGVQGSGTVRCSISRHFGLTSAPSQHLQLLWLDLWSFAASTQLLWLDRCGFVQFIAVASKLCTSGIYFLESTRSFVRKQGVLTFIRSLFSLSWEQRHNKQNMFFNIITKI